MCSKFTKFVSIILFDETTLARSVTCTCAWRRDCSRMGVENLNSNKALYLKSRGFSGAMKTLQNKTKKYQEDEWSNLSNSQVKASNFNV